MNPTYLGIISTDHTLPAPYISDYIASNGQLFCGDKNIQAERAIICMAAVRQCTDKLRDSCGKTLNGKNFKHF